MTGPHLTPEHEAEIRAASDAGEITWDEAAREAVADLLAALDAERSKPRFEDDHQVCDEQLRAEREAHQQTRTALADSTADLARAARNSREDKRPKFAAQLDARVVANQVALQLAVAEADKPHDGNER